MLNSFIEFVAALIAVLVIYFTIMVPLYPRVQSYNTNKYATPTKNVVDLAQGAIPLNSNNIIINTSNPSRSSFINLPKSTYYKQGGFAYCFWLNTKNSSNSSLMGKALLLRGLNKQAKVKKGNAAEQNVILVKMPLIRFATIDDFPTDTPTDEIFKTKVPIVIEYNTTTNPLEKWVINNDVLSITRGDKWFMVTVVFEDHKDMYGKKTGYKIDFYLDDRLVESKTVEEEGLLVNEGPIYILPTLDGSPSNSNSVTGFIADVRFLDFSPNAVEVSQIYDKSYSENNFITPKTQAIKTVYDDYRLMSLYNEIRANTK
jgi:hypothetical protein